MWYENTFRSSTASKKLAEGKHGFGYAFSAETGRRIALNDRWSLTPQAQLMWSSVSFGRFRDVWDTRVSLRNGDSLTGRLGIAADYRHSGQDARGRPASTNVYVIANLYQELLSDTRINVAGLDFGSATTGPGAASAWAATMPGRATSMRSMARCRPIPASAALRTATASRPMLASGCGGDCLHAGSQCCLHCVLYLRRRPRKQGCIPAHHCMSMGAPLIERLGDGEVVVISPGPCEPASIGTYTVIRYRDLDLGDANGSAVVPRDGSVIGARVTRQVDGSMRLLVTTETVGSGNYRNTDTFVLPKDGGVRLKGLHRNLPAP